VAVKRNLPVVVALLTAGAIVAAIFSVQPPDEDLLLRVAREHARTVGDVRDVRLSGRIAEIELKDGRMTWAQFEKRDGTWTFDRDLGREFERAMADPHVQEGLLQRLGTRVGQRLRADVKFKDGIEYQYGILKDEAGLAGHVVTKFVYPPGKDGTRRRGQYVEIFRWSGSCWKSEGNGSLFEGVPRQ
jgi:hypothetical protein